MIKRIASYYKRHKEVISILAGVVGLLFGIIQYFYPYSSNPKLRYYLRDKINVINISEGVDKIDVYFNKRNIRKDSLNLMLYKIRLKNDGQKSVSEGDYASIPFGLKVSNGSLVSVNYSSPDAYLKRSLNPRVDSTQLFLNKCIFDKGHYADLEILVIHKITEQPEFSPFGKISNIDSIIVEEGKGEDTDWIGIAEGIFVLILFLFAFAIVLSGMEVSIKWIKRYLRKRAILSFYDYPLSPLNNERRTIVNIIAEVGIKEFKKFFRPIIEVSGSYRESYQHEMDNKAAVDKIRTLIKNNEYEIEKVSAEKVVNYRSWALVIIKEIEESDCADSANKQLKAAFLLEITETLNKYR